MICYAVVDDYKKDASYAMKFKSVNEANASGFIDKFTPVLREITDVENAYDEDELIGIHCLLSFPKVVKYKTGVKRPRLYGREDRIEIISNKIPIRPGTTKYKIWSYIQRGITVAEFIAAIREAGLPGSAKDLQLAEKAGYIKVYKATESSK